MLPTLEEFKAERTKLLSAEVAPLSTREVMDLIGVTRANDHLRLHVPAAANPFQNSPLGQRQDYIVLHRLLSRAQKSRASDEIIGLLQGELPQISEESVSFMRASLAREHNMLELLSDLIDSMGLIHNRIIGSQEG